MGQAQKNKEEEKKKKISVWSLLMCEAYFMIKLSCNNTTPNGSRVKTLYADNTDTTKSISIWEC